MLDFLTDELRTSFRLGKQVWESDNHKAQRQLLMDAVERARLRYKLVQDDGQELKP